MATFQAKRCTYPVERARILSSGEKAKSVIPPSPWKRKRQEETKSMKEKKKRRWR